MTEDEPAWTGLLRRILYLASFAPDPLARVDVALASSVDGEADNESVEEYLAAVRAGLASERRLADLLPQDHPEEVIRAFFQEVERRLALRVAGG